jgi:hypothetical protein
MQIIVKTFDELQTLKVNGRTIYERVAEMVNGTETYRIVEYEYPDKSLIEISKDANSPISISKVIKEEEKVLDKVSVVDIESLNESRNSIIVEDAIDNEVVEVSPLLNLDKDVEVIEDYFEDKERSNSL